MTTTWRPIPLRDTTAPALDAEALVAHLGCTGMRLLEDAGGAWDGAALAALAIRWRIAYQGLGVAPGDRVAIALPGGAAFVGALLGALSLGATAALATTEEETEQLLEVLDARLVVRAGEARPGVAGVCANGSPLLTRAVARRSRGAPTREALLLLRTSGSGAAPRWIALSARNVGAVLASHAHALPPAGSVVASVLPWHHAFGLVLELLPALARGALLLRDPSHGRDGAALARLVRARGATHLSAVPATVARVAAAAGGEPLLRELRGGIVGGAPVEAPLAASLAGTRLRVGYGLTEASPGVSLGEPGEWSARALGRALGCETRVDDDGVLAFRGPNASLGQWDGGALVSHDIAGWRRTGDVVRATDGALWFEGRASAAFKLANGRWVEAWRVEGALRERMPALRDVMLASPDGERLVLLHTDGDALDVVLVRDALGPLAALSHTTRAVRADAWPRTRKGDVDRHAAQALAR